MREWKAPWGVFFTESLGRRRWEALSQSSEARPAANRCSPLRLEPLVSAVGARGCQLRPPNFGKGEMTKMVWNMRNVNTEPGRIFSGGKKKKLCLDNRDCGVCERERRLAVRCTVCCVSPATALTKGIKKSLWLHFWMRQNEKCVWILVTFLFPFLGNCLQLQMFAQTGLVTFPSNIFSQTENNCFFCRNSKIWNNFQVKFVCPPEIDLVFFESELKYFNGERFWRINFQITWPELFPSSQMFS